MILTHILSVVQSEKLHLSEIISKGCSMTIYISDNAIGM